MDCSYFNAALPEPYRILGLALKPLSLGRYRLLKRFECAFVSDGEARAGISDLLLGLVICSMSVDDFLASLDNGTLEKEIRNWGRKVCRWPLLSLLPFIGKHWRKKHVFDFREKCALFQRYLLDGSEMPKYWDQSEGGKESGAHWSQSVEVVLRGELGWSAEEINEAPLTKAFADYFRWAESNGLVQLMTPQEVELIKATEGN